MEEFRQNVSLTMEQQNELRARFSKDQQELVNSILTYVNSNYKVGITNSTNLIWAVIDVISSSSEEKVRSNLLSKFDMFIETCCNDELKPFEECLKYIINNFPEKEIGKKVILFFEIVDNIFLLPAGKERLNAFRHLMDKTGPFGFGQVRLYCILVENLELLFLILKFANERKIYLVHLHSLIRDLNINKILHSSVFAWETRELTLILQCWLMLKDRGLNIINPIIENNCIKDSYVLAEKIYLLRKLNIRSFICTLIEIRLKQIEFEKNSNEELLISVKLFTDIVISALSENYDKMTNKDEILTSIYYRLDGLISFIRDNSELCAELACDGDFSNKVFELHADQEKFYPNYIEDISKLLQNKKREKDKSGNKKSINKLMQESTKKSREQSSDSDIITPAKIIEVL
jgi:hypothetical protein